MAKETTTADVAKTTQSDTKNEYIAAVLDKINQFQENGDLKLPANYVPENAVRSAYLILLGAVDTNQTPVLQACTKESIANALLDMVLKGLNPAKKQGYFIAYGKKLEFQVSYMGNLNIAKRVAAVIDVTGAIIYEGDEFAYKIDLRTGRKEVTKHEQSFENIDNAKIKGAYATVLFEDGTTDVEIMNFSQIQLSWQQGKAKGNSPAHKNFPDQMALKTVKNRAVKVLIGSSDDEALFKEETEDYDFATDQLNHQVATKANKTEMNFGAKLPDPVTIKLPAADPEKTEPVIKNEPATTSEPARQVNNDAKSGLTPSSLFNEPEKADDTEEGPGFN